MKRKALLARIQNNRAYYGFETNHPESRNIKKFCLKILDIDIITHLVKKSIVKKKISIAYLPTIEIYFKE